MKLFFTILAAVAVFSIFVLARIQEYEVDEMYVPEEDLSQGIQTVNIISELEKKAFRNWRKIRYLKQIKFWSPDEL